MRFATALTLILATASAASADVVTTTTFESVSIPSNPGYINNAPAGFDVDGNLFPNSFNSTWGTWSGWALSSKTAPTPAEIASQPDYYFQYGAGPGKGADGSSNYAVAFGNTYINVADGQSVYSMAVTNTTYDYLSMHDGDGYAKQFGPTDFFTLHIIGHGESDGAGAVTGQIDFNLATGENILNDWTTIDLKGLGSARSLSFSFTSSDNDPIFGMNTPAYFALDDFRTFVPSAAVPEPTSLAMSSIGLIAVAFAARRGRGRKQTAA